MMKEEKVIRKYLQLIRSFTQGEETATEFGHRYIGEFKQDEWETNDETYRIIESLFFGADAYHEDPKLRGKYGIDAEKFSDEALEAQRKLEARLAEMNDSEDPE